MNFSLQVPLGEKGVAVPIFATFVGHKSVPLWAVATNSLNPKLRFFDDELELKVIRAHRCAWRDVENVDANLVGKTKLLTLNFADTPWNFSANLILPAYLGETLRFLDGKGLVLTPRAQQILRS